MRRFVLLAWLVLVIAACSESAESPTLAPGTTAPAATVATTASVPETTSPVPTSQAPTTTTLPPSTTTVVEPVIPIPRTEGEDDFEVIWRELIEYHNWAFQNPELADAELYISTDCECFANAAERLDEYRQNGWRETSAGLTVHDVDIDVATSTFALLTIIDEHSALVVVDAAGEVVRERDRRPKTFFDVRVRLLDEGWRIVEWFQRGAVGDAE